MTKDSDGKSKYSPEYIDAYLEALVTDGSGTDLADNISYDEGKMQLLEDKLLSELGKRII